MELIVHTPMKDYVCPPSIIAAAGYMADGSGGQEALNRIYQWADWMQYCEFGVNPNWSKKSP